MTRESILKEWEEHPYADFTKHESLIGLCMYPEEETDFEVVYYAVPSEWLARHWRTAAECPEAGVNENLGLSLADWIEKSKYDETREMFENALKNNQIVFLNF